MIVYISGKMTGNLDYKNDFQRAEEYLIEKGYAVINPAKVDDLLPCDALSYDDLMDIDKVMIDKCSAIYFLKNWTDSKGAKIEHDYALNEVDHDIQFMFEEE